MIEEPNLRDFPFPIEPTEAATVVEVRRDVADISLRQMAVNREVFDAANNSLEVARFCMDAAMNEAAAKIAGKSKAFFADCPPPEVAVYVIAPESGAVSKIGLANKPLSRLASLQTAHFETLGIRALFWCNNHIDAYALEGAAHKIAMASFDRRGEWFATDPVTAAIVVADALISSGMNVSSSEMWMRHRQLVRQQLRYWNDGAEPEGDLRVVA